MRSTVAFIKKELNEQIRSGRLLITLALFIMFGIMNPAIAKMTPWLMDIFSDAFAEIGIIVTEVKVSAMDSWTQFYKNIPLALIIFVLLQGMIFTKEYDTGTLILTLTRGLSRYKVVISKAGMLVSVWSVGYWLCAAITYLYNSFFWDNKVAESLGLSLLCWWLFGIFIIALLTLFSTVFPSIPGVLIGTGAVTLACYVIAFIPKTNKYLPTMLTGGTSLIYGLTEAKEYIPALIITSIASALFFAISIPIFNKRRL